MSDDAAAPSDDAPPAVPDVLVVQVQGGHDAAERVLRIARPAGGRVSVAEWSSVEGDVPARELSARALYDELDRALRQRRRVSPELYEVRRWLGLP